MGIELFSAIYSIEIGPRFFHISMHFDCFFESTCGNLRSSPSIFCFYKFPARASICPRPLSSYQNWTSTSKSSLRLLSRWLLAGTCERLVLKYCKACSKMVGFRSRKIRLFGRTYKVFSPEKIISIFDPFIDVSSSRLTVMSCAPTWRSIISVWFTIPILRFVSLSSFSIASISMKNSSILSYPNSLSSFYFLIYNCYNWST